MQTSPQDLVASRGRGVFDLVIPSRGKPRDQARAHPTSAGKARALANPDRRPVERRPGQHPSCFKGAVPRFGCPAPGPPEHPAGDVGKQPWTSARSPGRLARSGHRKPTAASPRRDCGSLLLLVAVHRAKEFCGPDSRRTAVCSSNRSKGSPMRTSRERGTEVRCRCQAVRRPRDCRRVSRLPRGAVEGRG